MQPDSHSARAVMLRRHVLVAVAGHLLQRALLSAHNRPEELVVHWVKFSTDAIREEVQLQPPDGIIASPYALKDLQEILALKLPTVIDVPHAFPHQTEEILQRTPGAVQRTAQVGIHESLARELAARHLIQGGFKSYATVGHAGVAFSALRREGFLAELKKHGVKCSDHIDRIYTPQEKRGFMFLKFSADMEAMLRTVEKPLGVLATDDYLGYEVLEACRRLDIEVPGQVAVVGITNDEEMCYASTPPLSSVMLPYDAQARHMWQAMQHLLEGKPSEKRSDLLLPARVAQRESTQRKRTDPNVALALKFIQENAAIRLSVQQVADHVMVSRRTLELAFQQMLSRSILDEIHHHRIEWYKELLADPSTKILTVARQAGFVQPEKFTTFFKQHTGMTPSDFRRSLLQDSAELENEHID